MRIWLIIRVAIILIIAANRDRELAWRATYRGKNEVLWAVLVHSYRQHS